MLSSLHVGFATTAIDLGVAVGVGVEVGVLVGVTVGVRVGVLVTVAVCVGVAVGIMQLAWVRGKLRAAVVVNVLVGSVKSLATTVIDVISRGTYTANVPEVPKSKLVGRAAASPTKTLAGTPVFVTTHAAYAPSYSQALNDVT